MSIRRVVAALCLCASPWAALAGSPAAVTTAAAEVPRAAPAAARAPDRSQADQEREEVLPASEGYRLLLAGAAAIGFVFMRRRD